MKGPVCRPCITQRMAALSPSDMKSRISYLMLLKALRWILIVCLNASGPLIESS